MQDKVILEHKMSYFILKIFIFFRFSEKAKIGRKQVIIFYGFDMGCLFMN
jgi:hypothetical protein